MKIVIDLTSLSYHITGIERYALCVTDKMLEMDRKNQYVLVFRDSVYPVFKKFESAENVKAEVIKGTNKLLFYQIVLPRLLYKIKADRYLFMAFTSPILFRKRGIINTIHDMGPWDAPDALKFLQKFYLKTTCRFSALASDGIITVSHFSKNRIVKILHYPAEKIRVINSAIADSVTKDYGISFEMVQEEYELPDKYIMTLSTLEPRKNMGLLLEAFSNIENSVDYDLVLVGRKGWKMDEVIERYNANKRIHITGFVKDEHIPAIYKKALCFIFPSLYEGFGLPPVEALSLGTPVVASDAASIPEVLMGQATYFKTGSLEELESILLGLEASLKNMAHGLNEYQIRKYRFDNAAKECLEFIEKC